MLLALVVVLGIMWCLARWARKPVGGKADRVMAVLARQQLSRTSSVAVLRVMDRALVLGVTEQGIRLIAETDLVQVQDVLETPAAPRRRRRAAPGELSGPGELSAPGSPRDAGTGNGRLDGSLLSPAMWRQLVTVARDLTVRR